MIFFRRPFRYYNFFAIELEARSTRYLAESKAGVWQHGRCDTSVNAIGRALPSHHTSTFKSVIVRQSAMPCKTNDSETLISQPRL